MRHHRSAPPRSVSVVPASQSEGSSDDNHDSNHAKQSYQYDDHRMDRPGYLHHQVGEAVHECRAELSDQIGIPFGLVGPEERGVVDAVVEDPGLLLGLEVYAGEVTHRGLAEDVNRPYRAYADIAG